MMDGELALKEYYFPEERARSVHLSRISLEYEVWGESLLVINLYKLFRKSMKNYKILHIKLDI